MRTRRVKDVRQWLAQQPSMDELSKAYPVEWRSVQRELADVLATRDFEKLRTYIQSVSTRAAGGSKSADAQLSTEIKQQMALAAVRRMCVSSATGVTHGRVRFNLLNGWIAQKLLFERDLERKPVSLWKFRTVWPLLWQRKFLMILVQPKGIYCFYTKQLVDRIVKLIDGRTCVEIAAGDGTLSRFLQNAGADVTATDDHSWTKTVQFQSDVVRQSAVDALRARQPEVVICSWPPAGNAFEEEVFRTDSVQLYIVIGSRHRFGTGDWAAYEQQTAFDLVEDQTLSRMVLPPEVEPQVLVFRRV